MELDEMSEHLELAVKIATDIHQGQKDKAGQPYILHPKRVMDAVEGDVEKQVAILHDVIEDSDLDLEDLECYGFSPTVIEAIDALTKRKGEDYFDFIERVKLNPIATKVKLVDLADNMDLSRLPEVSDRDLQRQARYEKAVKILKGCQD
jgi:(p)ppGpp synthase/HD superfamily hydrolase